MSFGDKKLDDALDRWLTSEPECLHQETHEEEVNNQKVLICNECGEEFRLKKREMI